MELSGESTYYISCAYEAQTRDLTTQLHTYANRFRKQAQYRWVNGRIVHPKTNGWEGISQALTNAACALTHIERGVGDWCVACKYGHADHSGFIKQGAKALGL